MSSAHAPAFPTILVVDDSLVNQLSVLAMLLDLGYPRPETAANGVEAVAACLRRRFDLILMDCDMPEMNGLEATMQLRRRGVTTPIVAFTASGSAYQRERCLAAGMDDFLDKPVPREVLATTLA